MSSTNLATSATSSFCPAPFPMAPALAASTSRSLFSTRNSRGTDSLAIPQSMDPQPTDPYVLFIHPPFNAFPNSNSSPDGLTYNLMAENPEWFLDPNDFVSANNPNPNALPYPPYLEPPRGWCPTKKKDLKERGAESWPEGEEPRLRCTFCRRTYAGVNAKSMWRRHVFEKHKIAMSNRRDGNSDRPRGRGSGKENKHLVSVKNSDSHDGLISIIVAPQTAPDTSTHKSRFRSERTEKSARRRDQRKQLKQGSAPSTPQRAKKTLTPFNEDESDSDVQKTITSPLTPHAEESSDPPNIVGSDSTAVTSPILLPPPESPYDPLQTPSFRHSPRAPTQQPWRYPTSHPLRSNKCDLSLTALAVFHGTPLVKGETTVTASPSAGIQSSPLSTAVATPASSRSFMKFGKRSLRFDQISSPLTAGTSLTKRQRILSSPLPLSTSRKTTQRHNRHPSDSSEFWFSEEHLASSKGFVQIESTLTDSFTDYESWPIPGGVTLMSPVRPLKRSMEVESPIVRSGSLTSLASDLPLLESYEGVRPIEDVDDDLKEILLSSPALKGDRCKQSMPVAIFSESSPPSKKRKIVTKGLCSSFP